MSVAPPDEPAQAPQAKTKRPHDSAYVYSSTKGKHWYAGFVTLYERETGRGEFIILALLLIFAVMGGSFFGFVLMETVVTPPAQVQGLCPAPAFIANNGCYVRNCVTPQNGAETCVLVPSGTIEGPLGH